MMGLTFAEAINKYCNTNFTEHLTPKLTSAHRVMRDLKVGDKPWLNQQEKGSPQYDLFYHLLEMQYFLQDLEEAAPLVYENFRKCYNVWAEEPYNSAQVEEMMSDIWD